MLTYHFWKSNRKGGFHYFAEAFCEMGYNVDFVLFPYSLFRIFTHRDKDRFNPRRVFGLIIGKRYRCKNSVVRNFGFPSLVFPPKWDKFKFNYLTLVSLYVSFFIILLRLRRKYQFVVLESTLAIVLVDIIRRFFPDTKIIYRQSDPISFVHNSRYFISFEKNVILKSDLTLFVNNRRRDYTLKAIPYSLVRNKIKILSNGVDLTSFSMGGYAKPSLYNDYKVTALYVGAFPIDWELLFYTADKLKYIHFVIITPSNIDKRIKAKINDIPNITFINGISPKQVPAFIQYSSIGIMPYAKKEKILRLMGMHSKIYQFMYFNKPIVTYNICLEINQKGIFQSFSKEEFLSNIKAASELKNIKYDFNFEQINWENISKQFVSYLLCLK
jgi:hypothetical protein